MAGMRKLWLLLLVVILVGVALGIYTAWGMLEVATGYSAKILCSGFYLSNRSQADLMAEDLEWFPFLGCRIEEPRQTAGCSFWGLVTSRALYRPELGCTLIVRTTTQELSAQAADIEPAPPRLSSLPRAAGGPLAEVDADRLERALESAFLEPDPEAPRRTRAVVVLFRGHLLAERYAPGIGPDTRLTGWSMTKSVINALVGILVGEGRLQLDAPAPVPEWLPPDPRAAITLNDLLQMRSGLAFEEVYQPPSDATRMLFTVYDTAAYAASRPMEVARSERWAYSSGTTNIVSRIVRQTVGGELSAYHRFARKRLFNPIGMKSAVMEPDPSGTFVGSSFMYATARDWARFGQLYLQDGIWAGRRILPEGWVGYSVRPVPGASKGRYGAHFWLNRGDPPGSANRIWPGLPADAFFASGFEGQFVVVIPSRRLVVVRLGLTHPPADWRMEELVSDVMHALPIPASPAPAEVPPSEPRTSRPGVPEEVYRQ